MDYSNIAIWMAALTLVLLVAEFFIPSGGMLSILAMISGAISVWGGYQAWWERSPAIWWIFITIFMASIPTSLAAAVVILPKTSMGRRLMSEPPSADSLRPFIKEREKLLELVGSEGRTATLHTPGGITEINGHRYHSESKGLMIDPSTRVEVIGVDGNRLIVQPKSENALEKQDLPVDLAETRPIEETPQTEENLDFPISED